MGKTEICWATDSWNPITGCSHAGSPGCDHCYARRMAKRLAGRYGYPEKPHEFDVTLHQGKMGEPLRWRKPRAVFVSSMGDLFHKDVDYQWLDIIFAAMAIASWHTFLVLTKRPALMGEYLSADRGGVRYTVDRIDEATADEFDYWDQEDSFVDPWPLQNVWLGVTVETQEQMWRVEELLKVPAARRFVSVEPCLGPVDLSRYLGGWDLDGNCLRCGLAREEGIDVCDCPPGFGPRLDGVIVGGESGPGARPMDPDWARSPRDQCLAAGVPFTFKQHGEYWTGEKGRVYESSRYETWGDGRQIVRCGKKAAGRLLDDQIWDEFPWKVLQGRSTRVPKWAFDLKGEKDWRVPNEAGLLEDGSADLGVGGPRKEG